MAAKPVFALNHMCAPALPIPDFLDLAKSVGAIGVEIRNDLEGNAILDGTRPSQIASEAEARGLTILSINALQRFNDWNAAREEEARRLIAYAGECGAKAVVLVPTNDGTAVSRENLRVALQGLRPLLENAGVTGLIEPLGFETCSLRLKSEAVEAIQALEAGNTFRLVHDTFHHFVAGEPGLFPSHTGLVHISGVTDPVVTVREMRDGHRVLVEEQDRLDNTGQITLLLRAGFEGAFSFEPFAEAVHRLTDPRPALERSIAFILQTIDRSGA